MLSYDGKGIKLVQEDILREKDHICIMFIIVYCYNCSILSLVIIVNLLLCLTYKLNITICIGENTVHTELCIIHSFRHPLGIVSPRIRGNECIGLWLFWLMQAPMYANDSWCPASISYVFTQWINQGKKRWMSHWPALLQMTWKSQLPQRCTVRTRWYICVMETQFIVFMFPNLINSKL